jgi:L-malate glycosyltransferase
MPAIHQFVAGFSNGDAISNETVVMRDIFRSWGHESCIFSETKRILPQLRKQARDVSEYCAAARPEDLVLLHLSIGSPVNEAFRSLPCKKAILYHNVTPAHYFDLINQRTAYNLAKGREQIAALAGVAEVNMADSRFNADELRALNYTDVRVLPLILDLEKLRAKPDRKTLTKFSGDLKNILFVGRCVPNKKIEHLINAFAYFQNTVDGNSRLIHVGSYAGSERYYYLLLTHMRDLGIRNVHFAGAATQAQLNAFYRCADLFLCMSEHEGFCIPVIESMLLDVPILAYAEAAVPETMDGAGVLFSEKRYDLVAEMMGRLIGDRNLRDAVLRGQRERIARFTSRDLPAELRKHLSPLLG